MIFSRRRGHGGRHSSSSGAARDGAVRSTTGRADDSAERTVGAADEVPVEGLAALGPYDVAHAPADEQQRIDLGALRIPAVAGVEIQIQAGPQGQVERIVLAHGGSQLHLAAFAAPRTEGVWDEVRQDLQASLRDGGARPEVVPGEYGPELRARVPDRSGPVHVRHVGIDGPRWFVHGVFLGAAALDAAHAGPLGDVLHGLVVDRGVEARPVREALPLHLPPEAAQQVAAGRAALDDQAT